MPSKVALHVAFCVAIYQCDVEVDDMRIAYEFSEIHTHIIQSGFESVIFFSQSKMLSEQRFSVCVTSDLVAQVVSLMTEVKLNGCRQQERRCVDTKWYTHEAEDAKIG